MEQGSDAPESAGPKARRRGPGLFNRTLGFIARRTAHYAPWHRIPFGLARRRPGAAPGAGAARECLGTSDWGEAGKWTAM